MHDSRYIHGYEVCRIWQIFYASVPTVIIPFAFPFRPHINWNVTLKCAHITSLASFFLPHPNFFYSFFSVITSFYSSVQRIPGHNKKFALSMVKHCSSFASSLMLLSAFGWQLPVPNLHMFDIHACHSWYPDWCFSKWLWHDTSKILLF